MWIKFRNFTIMTRTMNCREKQKAYYSSILLTKCFKNKQPGVLLYFSVTHTYTHTHIVSVSRSRFACGRLKNNLQEFFFLSLSTTWVLEIKFLVASTFTH